MSGDLDIAELLTELGFDLPESQGAARAALEAAQLTRPGKKRISDQKRGPIEQLLSGTFARFCGSEACQKALASSGRVPVRVSRNQCENCGGSDNRKAALRFSRACATAALRKVVVVGGSPGVREELQQLLGELELRLIDGTERRTGDRARGDVEWADLVLVWGGSELDHKVSQLYTDSPPPLKRKIIHVSRRGIAALLGAATEHVEGSRRR